RRHTRFKCDWSSDVCSSDLDLFTAMYIGIIAPTLERKHSPTKQRFELYHHVNTLSITRLKQTYYDQGESAGKLLAWRIKTLQNERAITEIETESGTTTNTAEMNRAFQKYYMNLHTSESPDTNDLHPFLDQLSIPTLEERVKEELDSPITKEELFEALSHMNGGKASGPSGLPIDIYKCFKEMLVPPLFDMLVE